MVALYRTYRPKKWSEVIGQDHVIRTLSNAIKLGRVSHAYLFCGLRGTGKTTVARIFAREIGCEDTDLIEIDAASNRGIDDMRRVRENAYLMPATGKRKVYIVDEAHMLTQQASNAILKVLEEPPVHVVFIFCTTEPEKLLDTIKSRVQRFNFYLVDEDKIFKLLRKICASEKITVEDDALMLITIAGGGSVRDAISILDALATLPITLDRVKEVLGLADQQIINALVESLIEEDLARCLDVLNHAVNSGINPIVIRKQFVQYLHALLVARYGRVGRVPVELSHVQLFDTSRLYSYLEIFNESGGKSKTVPQLNFELSFVRALGEDRLPIYVQEEGDF